MYLVDERFVGHREIRVKFIVDGNELSGDMVEGKPAVSVYREVVAKQFMSGRTVVGMLLDGVAATTDQQARLFDGEEVDAKTVEFQTIATADLARETLKQLLKHFEPLRRGMKLCVDCLDRGERVAALEAFRPTLEIWLTLCDAVQKVCLLCNIDISTSLGPSTVLEAHDKVSRSLGGIQSAFGQKDWDKLRSVLESELLVAVDEWELLVQALLAKVEGESPSGNA